MYYAANGFLIIANFKSDRVYVDVYHLKGQFKYPIEILSDLMWGNFRAMCGDVVGKFKYFHKILPLPSPIITAMNVLALEKIRKQESDPVARTRINCSLFPDLQWGAPIRAKPERVNVRMTRQYSPDGDHIPSIIRRAYGEQNDLVLQGRLADAVENYGRESHLFEKIKVKEYGIGHATPFEVRITSNNTENKIANVGYGVSQALPVIIQVAASPNEEYFIIQQPEVHLHPRAQAAFGEFFFDMATKRGHNFLIETHSDFLIDRFRLQLSKSRSKKKPSTLILFFHKTEKGNNTVTFIQVSKDGSYVNNLPENYKSFFFKEELNLLGIR